MYTIGPGLEGAVDAALMLRGDEDLLDVGTGPGDFPHRLKREGHRGRLAGVDASAGMIGKARSAGDGVEFAQADAQKLAFGDESFDVVTARHMLYHVPNIPAALLEARRVLRRGGRFLAVTNVSDFMGEYWEAVREAADTMAGGLEHEMKTLLVTSFRLPFTEKNGPGLLWDAFGNARMKLVKSALRFGAAEPAVRYFDSCRTLRKFSEEQWGPAREAMDRAVKKRLEAGPWIVNKAVVLLSAVKQ